MHLFNQPPRSLLIIKRRVALQAPPLFLRQRYIQLLFFLFFFLSPLGVAYRLARADKLAGANLLPLAWRLGFTSGAAFTESLWPLAVGRRGPFIAAPRLI